MKRWMGITAMLVGFAISNAAQTAGTGAIAGIVRDPAGAVVPGTRITATNVETGETRATNSSGSGDYVISLLRPGSYRVEASKGGFRTTTFQHIAVAVTETEELSIRLQVGSVNETVEVQSSAEPLQTETSALGHVTDGKLVESLPLVTRNYTQILSLSPGVAADVTNAGELGTGASSNGGDAMVTNGSTSSDNNFQMNGVEINDLQGSGYFSGGVAVPNPDTIEEFKVQTAMYDAAYGRNAGANVNVITKGGTNQFHGNLFEFFRNEALNANDFFLNQNHQPKPVLRQNQLGFTFGGPIQGNRLFFFTSYQGTRQKNGVDVQCSTSFHLPAFTNDRSRAALGALFAGQPTAFGGSEVAPDGSNISPQALALLQMKLPDGTYLIPNPQSVDPAAASYDVAGFYTASSPCTWNEDQFMTNLDWQQNQKSKWSARFFFANDHQNTSFPLTNLGGSTTPGFPVLLATEFRNLSLAHTYVISSRLLNQAEFGFHRTYTDFAQHTAFGYSDIAATVPSFENNFPAFLINGNVGVGGNGQGLRIAQNTFVFQDNVSWLLGKHSVRVGGGVTRAQNNLAQFHYLAGILFPTWPDFLVAQPGNILATVDLPGLFAREYRVWDWNTYLQDDFRVTPRLTLNLGFRLEHLGDLGEALGRNANFDPARANPNPPDTGSFDGFLVASNYPLADSTLPPGVIRYHNDLGVRGVAQNTLNPRIGFAWTLPSTDRAVLRGGYGVFHERTTGQPFIQTLLAPPWGIVRQQILPSVSFADPFPGPVPNFPAFVPYTPASDMSLTFFPQNFRAPMYQRYNLNLQTEVAPDLVFEIGYVGTRGLHMLAQRATNQASLASTSHPIRGETTNTVDNVLQRVPLQGFDSYFLNGIESVGSSWYNSLQTSLSKRFSHGLQFLASYTWTRDLATFPGITTGANGGFGVGNQNDPHARYGPDDFIRPHRFIVSYLYRFPGPRLERSLRSELLGGWQLAGVTTIQAGRLLPVYNTNVTNVFGINGFGGDFAELLPGCNPNTPGDVTSKLNNYINQSCFGSPPVVGDDGVATGFGNTRPGLIHGPDQRNTDLSLIKTFPVSWPNESANVEFRTEFFNIFNTPQFDIPDNEQDSGTFGVIQRTAVAPRILQFALKLNF